MVHYFVCDDFAYKVVPITLLNETDRTTEPKFTVTCQSDDGLLEFFLGFSLTILAFILILFFLCHPDPFGFFKRRIFSAYSWITTIICNIFFSIRKFFIRLNPAKYWPLPTSQTSEETGRGSALLPFHTTRASSVDDPPSYSGDGASETSTVYEVHS
ncbi:hypothetical protein K457DRAFT_139729 [Linnemannia elongata AG-77]|uniref:Uncharacterized protein n=1 Tax=Linnemannia elongata AG-77 TaxID=1314771 RepID=A0A197JQC5_9FUNG|nr:hypothetical protein K457DRAFT_139729 [Linnemannia elongata AG-77]